MLADMLVDCATRIKEITARSMLDTYPSIQIKSRSNWQRFKQSVALSPIDKRNLVNINAMENIITADGIKFLLSRRPEPVAFTLQTGAKFDFNADLGIIRSIIFSDGTTWDAVSGWK